jgi:peptide/nickel transport system permease protein
MSEINKTKIKILEIIISSVIGLLFSFAFCIITQPSFLIFIMFCFLGIMIPGFISIRSSKRKYDNKHIITLIKKIIKWITLGWIIWPGFGVFIGPFIGFYFATKKDDNKNFSFQKYAWNQFKKNKIALVCLYMLFFLILLARFSPYIANTQPLYAVYKGQTMWPAFSDEKKTVEITDPETGTIEKLQFDITDWRQLDLDKVVYAPIPYSPDFLDRYNRNYVAPGGKQNFKTKNGEIIECPKRFRHLLGTDGKGADLASGLIHGTKIALQVGLISMGIASFIGIILGALAGFFGDRGLKMRRNKYYCTLIGIFLGFFYGFGQRKYEIIEGFEQGTSDGVIQIGISIIIIIIITFVVRQLSRLMRLGFLQKEVTVPVDSFISRSIELLNSIPRILLIITVTAIMERSLVIIMVIIGITGWTRIARFTRAEFLRIRNLEYIQASKALGFSSIRTIFKHALPNALAPVFVSIAFGIAAAILIESGLSFLGIGVPDDVVTWGSLLNLGKQNIDAWWLVIFPGIAIFITVTIYNMIAEASRDALDPKLKS